MSLFRGFELEIHFEFDLRQDPDSSLDDDEEITLTGKSSWDLGGANRLETSLLPGTRQL